MIISIFISASGTPKWLVHTLSSIIGLGLLISFFNTNIIFQIGLTLSAWIMLQISHKIGHGCRGLLSLILCVSFNLICELFFATPVDWQSIRGMVVINRVMYIKPLVNEDFDLSHLKEIYNRAYEVNGWDEANEVTGQPADRSNQGSITNIHTSIRFDNKLKVSFTRLTCFKQTN